MDCWCENRFFMFNLEHLHLHKSPHLNYFLRELCKGKYFVFYFLWNGRFFSITQMEAGSWDSLYHHLENSVTDHLPYSVRIDQLLEPTHSGRWWWRCKIYQCWFLSEASFYPPRWREVETKKGQRRQWRGILDQEDGPAIIWIWIRIMIKIRTRVMMALSWTQTQN